MKIKLPRITKAKLVLTEACQLNCKYCYEVHGTKVMSLDTAKDIIDMIIKNASESRVVPKISFFGGEPLLVYEELMKPCIEYIRSELKVPCNIGFTTNGLLLDEEKLQYLRSMNVPFMLSIDGCEVAHDMNRVYADGTGSFLQLESILPLLLEYFPGTRARMTLTPENLPYLHESVRYIESVGFTDMHVIPNLHIDTGRDWEESDYLIAEDQLRLLSDYIIRTFEQDEVPLIFQTLSDMFPRIVLAQYSERVNHHRVATCCIPEKRCGIGVRDNVIIDTQGNIFSCQHGSMLPSESNILYLGNMESGISEERRLALLEANRKDFTSESLDCEECPLYRVCTGGCVPNNYVITGEFTTIPESYCRWTQCLYKAALEIVEYFDRDQTNILFKDYFYGIVKRGVYCVC